MCLPLLSQAAGLPWLLQGPLAAGMQRQRPARQGEALMRWLGRQGAACQLEPLEAAQKRVVSRAAACWLTLPPEAVMKRPALVLVASMRLAHPEAAQQQMACPGAVPR